MSLLDSVRNYQPKPKVKVVEGLDWPFPVYVRKLTIAELHGLQKTDESSDLKETVAKVICDENGTCVFDSPETIDLLDKFTLSDVAYIAKVAAEFNNDLNPAHVNELKKS